MLIRVRRRPACAAGSRVEPNSIPSASARSVCSERHSSNAVRIWLNMSLVALVTPAGTVEFGADEESHGTMVWFGLARPVVHALASGSVLLVDEIEAARTLLLSGS